MKIEMVFLRSKVARRIFLLFIISSLIPVTLLALLSFGQVNNLITKQQHEQLRQTSKNYGVALLERLLLLKMQIGWIAQGFRQEDLSISSIENNKFNSRTGQGFKQIGLITNTNQSTFPLENIEKLIMLIQAEQNYLKAGNSILTSDYQSHFSSRIFLLRMLDPQHPEQAILVGEIDQSYLWGDTDSLGSETQLCVLDELNRALFCSHQEYEPSTEQLIKLNKSSSGQFTWHNHGHEEYLINYWSIFLEPNFLVPKWTVITRQSKANILVPIADFRNIFAFVITLTLAIVALLSVHQIRRNLIPLEKLMEGVQHIANKKFNKPVEVSSGDEFEELATSVNNMAVQIDKQFHILSTMVDIDQLILSTLKIEDIIKIVLTRMHEIIPYDCISMTVINRNHNNSCRTYTRNELFREKITVDVLEITLLEYQILLGNQNYIIITNQKSLPSYLSPLQKLGVLSFLILPIVLKEEVSAIICLGYRMMLTLAEEDIFLARDFTNHVAVALSNASWEEQLYYMAHYDALTGLPNRLLLNDRLQQALARAERQKSFVAILFIDLDRFKYVNDSLGHIAGDLLLCEVAQRLSRNLRSEDTISRLGGDEFIIIISHFDNIQESLSITTTIAKKIIADLSIPFNINDREIYSTASIGIACYPTDGKMINELLKNADSAMYHAKSIGKNNYQFYSKILNAAALERLDMENSLRHALERCEFELYYQPKIEIRSRQICGAEVLLRWNHPQKGRVSPAQFIPLCEEIGLIIAIGEWIIHTACMQAKRWQDQGFLSLRIAVNLSPLQFRQPDLIKQVKNILDTIELSPSKLEFEITESAAMEDINKTITTLGIFKSMGLHLSIDDFGTGYSSLSYLKRFPIHTLKIDQSFIHHLNTSFEDAAIVKSIITLAHSLKLSVVAEGVETKEQLDYLCNLDCDEIQGYLFSPPISADEFTKLLGSQTVFYCKA
ncbi:MAG: EAL domain-containing protein [Candidatus Competibacteraceae bacterium]